MRLIRLIACLFVLLSASSIVAAEETENEIFQRLAGSLTDEQILNDWLGRNFLTLSCEVPQIRPMLSDLSSSPTVDTSVLITQFFGDAEAVTGRESMKNALWGSGTRYKSGQKIVVGPRDMPIQQAILQYGAEVDLSPVYLDVFNNGFAYRNNVPHKPVYASTHLPKSLYNDPTVKFDYVYQPTDGQTAAETLINEMFGEITVPEGFQSAVDAYVLQTGERLFYYKAHPQFKTTFKLYEGSEVNAKGEIVQIATGEAKVAIPVLDRFVTVILDGDKVLAGLDFFWDNSIKATGQPQECIPAMDAIQVASKAILEYYEGSPPLITVREIKLGYIQNRHTPGRLIPVWMFDAAYARPATAQEMLSTEIIKYADTKILVPFPFAVNALTSEPFLL